jgi:cold shock CspA family protein
MLGASVSRVRCLRKDIPVHKGIVKRFSNQHGFGVTQPANGGNDVFLDVSAIERAGMP